MAIVHNGCKVSLPSTHLPEGYAKPNVVTFDDWTYPATLTLNIPKATVQNADPAITMDNILDDAAVGVNKQVLDIITADFLGSANVTAYSELVGLGNSIQSMKKGSPVFTNAAVNFIATVKLYVKAV